VKDKTATIFSFTNFIHWSLEGEGGEGGRRRVFRACTKAPLKQQRCSFKQKKVTLFQIPTHTNKPTLIISLVKIYTNTRPSEYLPPPSPKECDWTLFFSPIFSHIYTLGTYVALRNLKRFFRDAQDFCFPILGEFFFCLVMGKRKMTHIIHHLLWIKYSPPTSLKMGLAVNQHPPAHHEG